MTWRVSRRNNTGQTRVVVIAGLMNSETEKMNRREFALAGGSVALGALCPGAFGVARAQQPDGSFSRATVIEAARRLAKERHRPPAKVAPPFSTLGYDQYRDIQFRSERAVWVDESRGFALELLHAGFIYAWPTSCGVGGRPMSS